MHLRPPSIDPGITAFLWAFGLALYLWLFMLAVAVDGATAAIISALAFFAIFLFVRLCGEEELPHYRARRRVRPGTAQARSSSQRPR